MPEIIDAINKYEFPVDPDSINHEYVDLGIEMGDGKKLYFATMNVGATAIEDVGSRIYRWGATEAGGAEWKPETPGETWSEGHKLDAAHDIATIKWGPEWHIPSIDEWNLLLKYCDYERKEANECIYGVMGYFFYKKSDHNTFIFLPGATWINEIKYWTSENSSPSNGKSRARQFNSSNNKLGCLNIATIESTGMSIRPVCVK